MSSRSNVRTPAARCYGVGVGFDVTGRLAICGRRASPRTTTLYYSQALALSQRKGGKATDSASREEGSESGENSPEGQPHSSGLTAVQAGFSGRRSGPGSYRKRRGQQQLCERALSRSTEAHRLQAHNTHLAVCSGADNHNNAADREKPSRWGNETPGGGFPGLDCISSQGRVVLSVGKT